MAYRLENDDDERSNLARRGGHEQRSRGPRKELGGQRWAFMLEAGGAVNAHGRGESALTCVTEMTSHDGDTQRQTAPVPQIGRSP